MSERLRYEANLIYWLSSAAFLACLKKTLRIQEFKIFRKKLKFKPRKLIFRQNSSKNLLEKVKTQSFPQNLQSSIFMITRFVRYYEPPLRNQVVLGNPDKLPY